MIDPLGSLINGMFFALGTIIVSTIAIYIGFKRGNKFFEQIIAWIVESWTKVKEEGIDGLTIDAKVKTKKNKK